MSSPRLVAAGVALGNYIQGWDASALAGAMLYIKSEFAIEASPSLQGLVVSSSIIGSICCTSIAGVLADRFGRRTVLSFAGILLVLGSFGMSVSPSIRALVTFRIMTGCAIGLVGSVVPLLIAETAPTDIRGQMATFPQLTNSSGTFSGYFVVFVLSLIKGISWRIMSAALMIPSFIYVGLCLLYLPESPRWLVSRGNMNAARQVLQNLLGKEDVTGELAMLVEGLGGGGKADATLEDYIIEPTETPKHNGDHKTDGNAIQIFGLEDDQAWIAKPSASFIGKEHGLSRFGSQFEPQSINKSSMVDLSVSVSKSFHQLVLDGHHENFNVSSYRQWDEENPEDDEKYDDEEEEEQPGSHVESGPSTPPGGLKTPLLYSMDSEHHPQRSRRGMFGGAGDQLSPGKLQSRGSIKGSYRGGSMGNITASMTGAHEESMGGGWQVGWKYQEGDDKNHGGSLKRVFLFPQSPQPPITSAISSMRSLAGMQEPVHVSALVGEPALCMSGKQLESVIHQKGSIYGPAVVHPAKMAEKGLSFSDFTDIRVRRALLVGMTLQFLQQFCGIGAVLYFTPQILQQSGIDDLLVQLGLQMNSASLLASAVTCLPMLPFIVFSMFLMDRAGRRQLLLFTTPLLFVILFSISTCNVLLPPGIVRGISLVLGVTVYLCAFNMGFGPVPNIICSEIFPTKVRGVSLGLCGLVTWLCNMLISFLFPILNKAFGLSVVFGFFGIVCALSWVFVYLKVPETKGFPLEVITEFFALKTTKED